ncbi:hypothetical protein [Cellulomonas sp. P24]|uniref:hypothetical protein n=1 Tax=Cellulomonas sp. P24 TaxID=2885206 RepID=UPI00216B35A0|nr:hypothetical protein [Cellulomonas sp. P24]MCR6491553.1 hypothetical protein [Cellulomonas sp. P24]
MDIREFGRERTRQATTLVAIGSVLGVGTVFGVAATDIAATKAAAAAAASTGSTGSGTTGATGTQQPPSERPESDDGANVLGLPGASSGYGSSAQGGTTAQGGTSAQGGTTAQGGASGVVPVQPGDGRVTHGFSTGS